MVDGGGEADGGDAAGVRAPPSPAALFSYTLEPISSPRQRPVLATHLRFPFSSTSLLLVLVLLARKRSWSLSCERSSSTQLSNALFHPKRTRPTQTKPTNPIDPSNHDKQTHVRLPHPPARAARARLAGAPPLPPLLPDGRSRRRRGKRARRHGRAGTAAAAAIHHLWRRPRRPGARRDGPRRRRESLFWERWRGSKGGA